jgi:hypothetical protein
MFSVPVGELFVGYAPAHEVAHGSNQLKTDLRCLIVVHLSIVPDACPASRMFAVDLAGREVVQVWTF